VISPLLTDLYQLTMAQGYWKLGLHERPAVFHHIFRKFPFGGNYAVAAGLASAVSFLEEFRFGAAELAFLATLRAPAGEPLFEPAFLEYLQGLRLTCDIDAIAEGTLVFPHEPLLRVTGPLLQGQLLETALLNIVNFQTLIATKAARVCLAAEGDRVLEFGLRRAQGPDGGLSASRAAYIGGCASTSSVLAGQQFGIPVSGTLSHSWITAFDSEQEAFEAFAEVMPHNFVLLVDTYDTRRGVQNAIRVAEKMRKKGVELRAIRIDSGDLAALSIEARQALDAHGFLKTEIIASNSLDEHVIADLKKRGAKISVWGVGTSLVTAYDYPALDGVYKLSALKNAAGAWEHRLKLSEDPEKTSIPGILQVRRFYQDERLVADVIYDQLTGLPEGSVEMVPAPHFAGPFETVPAHDRSEDLLQPVLREGLPVQEMPDIHSARKVCIESVTRFAGAFQRKVYPVGLEQSLYRKRQQQAVRLRQG